jgi:hypothetical protein
MDQNLRLQGLLRNSFLKFRYMFHSLEVALDGPALMLGDNMSVVLDTTVSSSILKKNHNAIA